MTNAKDNRLAQARERLAAWRWLESTKDLQEQAYGYDFRAMARSPRALCEYLTHMTFAAMNELMEASLEFEWKHWTSAPPWVDRDRLLEELVDADHFVANMAVALGCTDEEWSRLYQAKQARNRERMAGRYAGRRGKA